MPGTKLVVGDGPQRRALARSYAEADVFVFPSLTDTFGLMLLKSLASGVPVAAYPATGPADVLEGAPPGVGALDDDLRAAALRAHAERFSWRACADGFLANLVRTGT